MAWAAKKAGAKEWHAEYVETEASPFVAFLQQMETGEAPQGQASDLVDALAAQQHALLGRIEADVTRLIGGGGMRAYCVECLGDDAGGGRGAASERFGLLRLMTLLLGGPNAH